jgi:hypothetical protein
MTASRPNNSNAHELYLVFSDPSDSVSEAEFMAWYDQHIPEILETDGFVSAQRYRVTPITHDGPSPPRQRYLVLWETTKDINELRAELSRRGAAGEFTLPEWFTQTRYLTWSCEPVGERFEAGGQATSE